LTPTVAWGNQEEGGPTRYTYLGTDERKRDTNSGLILMGARVYNSYSGRFLQTDPVLGGSANSYDYVSADPINSNDIAGTNADPCQNNVAWSFCLKVTSKDGHGLDVTSIETVLKLNLSVTNPLFFVGWQTAVVVEHDNDVELATLPHVITENEALEYDPTVGFIGHVILPKGGKEFTNKSIAYGLLWSEFGLEDNPQCTIHS
jgi:RHS repeat-associated protein